MRAALEAVTDAQWAELWAAVDAVAAEETHAEWVGGTPETRVVDGVEQTVTQMPYPIYSEAVERLRSAIGGSGLIVPYDWMHWEDLDRYRGPTALADAPVTDAVRMLVAIIRAERFGDGNIEGALKDGTMQAALARIRRWQEERPTHPRRA